MKTYNQLEIKITYLEVDIVCTSGDQYEEDIDWGI